MKMTHMHQFPSINTFKNNGLTGKTRDGINVLKKEVFGLK